MKISLALGPRQPLDRATAWACALTNQFTLPGLGSLVSGRRVGYAQLALAMLGAGPMLAFTVRLLFAAYHVQQAARTIASFQELLDYVRLRLQSMPQSWGLYFWIGVPGLIIFVISWLWALASSVAILRESYANCPRKPTPESGGAGQINDE